MTLCFDIMLWFSLLAGFFFHGELPARISFFGHFPGGGGKGGLPYETDGDARRLA